MHLRVYNYNTMEKVKEWEAHTDYIRFIEVHPNRPLVISSSDDMSIKLWDWEKDWDCVQVFEGHVHYVMMVKINPRDTNTFASASLDRFTFKSTNILYDVKTNQSMLAFSLTKTPVTDRSRCGV